jgi:hypothetical protein
MRTADEAFISHYEVHYYYPALLAMLKDSGRMYELLCFAQQDLKIVH